MKINFNHLYYFWTVVRLGGVSQGAEELHLTPQTISGQLKQLQKQFPEPLLLKVGRQLQLSPLGERVFEHAETMFADNRALLALTDRQLARAHRKLRIGASDVLPKLTVRWLLEPALLLKPRPSVSVREVDLSDLLVDLGHRRLDAVIADRPTANAGHARANCQLLLTTELSIYAAEPLAGRLFDDFPRSLGNAPALLPSPTTYARRLLDEWFHRHGLRPEIVGEMDDSALVGSFGRRGYGFFAAPADQADAIEQQYQVKQIGTCKGVKEQFYVITLQSGPLNPTVNDWLAAWGQVAGQRRLRAASS